MFSSRRKTVSRPHGRLRGSALTLEVQEYREAGFGEARGLGFDPHEVLGLEPGANLYELDRAYQLKCLETADGLVSPHSAAAQRHARVHAAYEFLSDPKNLAQVRPTRQAATKSALSIPNYGIGDGAELSELISLTGLNTRQNCARPGTIFAQFWAADHRYSPELYASIANRMTEVITNDPCKIYNGWAVAAMGLAMSAPQDPSFRNLIGRLTRETQPGHPSSSAIEWFTEMRNYLTDDVLLRGKRNPEHVPVVRDLLKAMVDRYPSLAGAVPDKDRKRFEDCLREEPTAQRAFSDLARPLCAQPHSQAKFGS